MKQKRKKKKKRAVFNWGYFFSVPVSIYALSVPTPSQAYMRKKKWQNSKRGVPLDFLCGSQQKRGVHTVAQWVKNPTVVAQVTVEMWVWSSAQHSGLKDTMLPQLCCSLKLQLRFSPWPRNFHMLWVLPLKKKSKRKIITISLLGSWSLDSLTSIVQNFLCIKCPGLLDVFIGRNSEKYIYSNSSHI